MSGKFALIIGNTEYTDPSLAKLTAPTADAKDLARVLKDPKLCAFDDVKISLNQLSSSVIEQIDEFFDSKKVDDLLILYFSGHGIRDEFGALHLAFKNTIRTRLRSTTIKADYVREAMDQSRSKRQVLILDCCNSGAFPQGTKAELGGSMGLMSAFQGYGRYVLTASDATQFAWEGNKVIGKTDNSLFTHYLVQGLEEGVADQDGDGRITVDDLYEYAFEEISKVTPNQTPTKSASKQAGEIILRQIARMEDIRPVSLPDELTQALIDPRPFVREGAVEPLERYLHGKNLGWARSAKEALEKLSAEDDSLRVRQTAIRALATLTDAPSEVEEEQSAAHGTAITTPPVFKPQAQAETVVPVRSDWKEAPVAQHAAGLAPRLRTRPLIVGAVGLLVVVVAIAVVFALRSPDTSTTGQDQRPLASVVNPTQAGPALPATAPLQATGFSTAANSPEPPSPLPPTSLPVVSHLMQPPEAPQKPGLILYDSRSLDTGAEQRAPEESYQRNRLERPFLQDMTYVPDLDILTFNMNQDDQWNYISIQLAGKDPNNPLGIHYGVEIDLNNDGYGDFLIWAHPPYGPTWETMNVQVFKDTNHDTGGTPDGTPNPDFRGDGYDSLIFNGGTSQDGDPDLAWVRMVGGERAVVQFAFKQAMTGPSFLWGAVADAGHRDVTQFDYRLHFSQAEAGSPVRSSQYYPLRALFAVDNTCWQPNKIKISGSELKVCQVTGPTTGGGTVGVSCNPKPVCTNGYDPNTCQCK